MNVSAEIDRIMRFRITWNQQIGWVEMTFVHLIGHFTFTTFSSENANDSSEKIADFENFLCFENDLQSGHRDTNTFAVLREWDVSSMKHFPGNWISKRTLR
jgi:hypothetical protein